MGWIVTFAVLLAALCAWLAILLRRVRREKRRFQLVGEITAVSEGNGALEETLGAICDILVPSYADFCMIDVVRGGRIRRAAVRVAPEGGAELERGLAERGPSLPQRMFEAKDPAALAPRLFERVTEADLRGLSHNPEDLQFLRGLGARSAITVALKARGKVIGALTVGVAWSGRRYRKADAHFTWVLSGRVALALDNSGLFAHLERAERARSEIATTLQRGLLPLPLPHIPGWSLAAMYRPAGAENDVGGDFYDAFRIAGGWMLVMGDVAGRGAQAASITAQARYTLRTAAVLTGDPLVSLGMLNRALLARGDGALCSLAILALSDDPAQPVKIALAGHPAPLLLAGGTVSEAARADPLLGAFKDAEWRLRLSFLETGQQLVVVTDGITEAKGVDGRFGEERLHAELAGAASPALAARRLEGSLHSFTDGTLEDDAAILVVGRVSGAAPLDHSPPLAGPRSTGSAMTEEHTLLLERVFDAFNRRGNVPLEEICDEHVEFFPLADDGAGRREPYLGAAGLREYLADMARSWEEIAITPSEIERRGELLLVRGRVYVRSHRLGIRDMPVTWIWKVCEGRLVCGQVFPDPEAAIARFAEATSQPELSAVSAE